MTSFGSIVLMAAIVDVLNGAHPAVGAPSENAIPGIATRGQVGFQNRSIL